MKVTLVQMNSISDKAVNLAQARRLIEQAVTQERPDWICLPEVFDFMGGSRAEKMAAAEELPGGPAYEMCSELARKHKIFIHAGSILEKIADEDRLHNTSVAFNREGKEVARYRKIHMFDITAPDGAKYHESAAFKAGDAIVTYDVEGVKVGCAICYDLRFPYLFQALAEQGVEVELIDVRTLLPFDIHHSIVKSLQKTNRILFVDEDVPGGATAFMLNEVMNNQGGFRFLDCAPRTLAAKDHLPAYGSDGDYFSKPSSEDVYDVIMDMMAE